MMEEEPRIHRTDIDACLDCAHYQALGCAGRTVFCVKLDRFLVHEPTRPKCPHHEKVRESDQTELPGARPGSAKGRQRIIRSYRLKTMCFTVCGSPRKNAPSSVSPSIVPKSAFASTRIRVPSTRVMSAHCTK